MTSIGKPQRKLRVEPELGEEPETKRQTRRLPAGDPETEPGSSPPSGPGQRVRFFIDPSLSDEEIAEQLQRIAEEHRRNKTPGNGRPRRN